MRKIIICLLVGVCLLTNCSKKSDSPSGASKAQSCGTYKSGQQLYLGPEGGCYYMSSGGNKEYVDRSACKCN